MGRIPTVKIHDPAKRNDFRIINEADFDPEKHVLWDERELPPEERTVPDGAKGKSAGDAEPAGAGGSAEAARGARARTEDEGGEEAGNEENTPPELTLEDLEDKSGEEIVALLKDRSAEEVLGVLPEGYRAEKKGGGYYFLFGPSGAAIPGPSNGKWQGADGTLVAALDHRAIAGGGDAKPGAGDE